MRLLGGNWRQCHEVCTLRLNDFSCLVVDYLAAFYAWRFVLGTFSAWNGACALGVFGTSIHENRFVRI